MSSLVEAIQQSEADRHAKNVNRYRELLLKNDSRDAKELRGIMDVEGIAADQLASDLAIFARAASLGSQAARWTDESESEYGKACEAVRDHSAETERLVSELETKRVELEVAASMLFQAKESAQRADRDLQNLKRQNHVLFDLDAPAPVQEAWSGCTYSGNFDNLPDATRDKKNGKQELSHGEKYPHVPVDTRHLPTGSF